MSLDDKFGPANDQTVRYLEQESISSWSVWSQKFNDQPLREILCDLVYTINSFRLVFRYLACFFFGEMCSSPKLLVACN